MGTAEFYIAYAVSRKILLTLDSAHFHPTETISDEISALLEPRQLLVQFEAEGDFSSRLALQEELKAMPANAVWDDYCQSQAVPVGMAFMDVIKSYKKTSCQSESNA